MEPVRRESEMHFPRVDSLGSGSAGKHRCLFPKYAGMPVHRFRRVCHPCGYGSALCHKLRSASALHRRGRFHPFPFCGRTIPVRRSLPGATIMQDAEANHYLQPRRSPFAGRHELHLLYGLPEAGRKRRASGGSRETQKRIVPPTLPISFTHRGLPANRKA